MNGVTTFAGLTLDEVGGHTLAISSGGLGATVSGAIEVNAPPPPIIGEQVITAGKGKHRHASGFDLLFGAALDPSRAQDSSNYNVTETVKHGRKTSIQAVDVQASYNASARSASLMLVGKAPFTRRGQLIVNAASPGGITDTSGIPLDGDDEGVAGDNGAFVILPKATGVVR